MTSKENEVINLVNSYFEDQKRIDKRYTLIFEAIRMDVETVLKNALRLSNLCGKWVHLGGNEWCCSCCGEKVTIEDDYKNPKDKGLNYCSCCGAELGED